MNNIDLDTVLRRFYAEARTKKGEEYSRSFFLGIRNAVERHFAGNNKSLKISKSPLFQRSNKMLECKLKLNRRLGKENVQHKPVIDAEDIEKIRTSSFMNFRDPAGLLRRIWFVVTLYWCRRGCEGQRQLRSDSFELLKDSEGQSFAIMTHDEQSKNHQGGMKDKPSHEKQTRLYSTGVVGDSYWCLQQYINKLNPDQQAFFQRPKPNATEDQQIWYENKPLGINTLEKMMKEISIGAALSRKYTNHCVRATAITIWSNAEVPSRHIMSISGHSNESSIASYNSRPTTHQLKRCSNILSAA
ncbi:hypothetical protein QZH41_002267 [Actinostola sp. cb2023]|nr:hypothetical protein QZH41_002267 [Actinostola sp. cb2023]